MTPDKQSRQTTLRHVRLIAAHRRSAVTDRALAVALAAIAGCANAGGFVLLGNYTSHMTGYLSQVADNIVLHNLGLFGQGVLAIGLFVTGAATSAFVINWARWHVAHLQYALTIGIQGVLFLALATLGLPLAGGAGQSWVGLGLLCFIMGFQNATITKISGARIRTTHATGMITDIGIEFGRGLHGWRYPAQPVRANRANLSLLLQLIGSFLVGGVAGAVGYGTAGYGFSVVLGGVLITIAVSAATRRRIPHAQSAAFRGRKDRLSSAKHKEHAMKPKPPETEVTQQWKVACDGGGSGGHPRVWLPIPEERGWVECGYCDKRFVHQSMVDKIK